MSDIRFHVGNNPTHLAALSRVSGGMCPSAEALRWR